MKIEQKIEIAQNLYAIWAEVLRAEPAIRHGLADLSECVKASSLSCLESGVVKICRRCDEEEGGSCCGAGIEERYTPEMILINMLLGVDIPGSRPTERGCWFLGGRGCVLASRDIICINYMCARVREEVPAQNLIALQTANGREMDVLFSLHGGVRNRIIRQGG